MDAFFLIALLLEELSVLLFLFLLNLFLGQLPPFILTFPEASHEGNTRFPVKLYPVPTPLLFILRASAGFSHNNKL